MPALREQAGAGQGDLGQLACFRSCWASRLLHRSRSGSSKEALSPAASVLSGVRAPRFSRVRCAYLTVSRALTPVRPKSRCAWGGTCVRTS